MLQVRIIEPEDLVLHGQTKSCKSKLHKVFSIIIPQWKNKNQKWESSRNEG